MVAREARLCNPTFGDGGQTEKVDGFWERFLLGGRVHEVSFDLATSSLPGLWLSDELSWEPMYWLANHERNGKWRPLASWASWTGGPRRAAGGERAELGSGANLTPDR